MGTTIFVVLLSDGEGDGSGPGLEEFVPGPEDPGVGGKGEFDELEDGLPGGGRITDDGPGEATGLEFEGGLESGEPPGLEDDGGEPDGEDEGEFGPGGSSGVEADGLGVEAGENGDGGLDETMELMEMVELRKKDQELGKKAMETEMDQTLVQMVKKKEKAMGILITRITSTYHKDEDTKLQLNSDRLNCITPQNLSRR
ncbi:hypothetical protein AXG93_3005s1120 [Marchantia polymorpha subsp. ruderalis]|uniref:Uncharacterized protein n=1 Tax=Marchantia polymorpha subsp. ruderalis TaxID=1480154 RepID=A0A176WP03_MARPO|nr:hypothetical protein AXG93_3005s1120 [Marchantia polymorpha subsp. ruderalis]